MASFNKVILLGNLTRDPQLSYTPNQTAVVDFGLATNRKWTGQDGQARDEIITHYHELHLPLPIGNNRILVDFATGS